MTYLCMLARGGFVIRAPAPDRQGQKRPQAETTTVAGNGHGVYNE